MYSILRKYVLFSSSVQLLSRVQLSATPWTAARQTSLSITNSQSLLKLMSVESVMPSNHLILCQSLLLPPSVFPSIRVFSSESVLCIRCRSIGASASASVLPVKSVQFSSAAQSCLTLWDPMDLSVHHQLPEFTQTHVH